MDVIGLPARLNRRLARARAMAEARMLTRCTIAHQGAPADRVTGEDGMEVTPWLVDATARPCRLVALDNTSRDATVGVATEESATRRLDLAHDTRLVDGQVARIDSGEWAGTYWRIREAVGADQKSALRVRVEQVQRPRGWPS